jgi:hypothetical protein
VSESWDTREWGVLDTVSHSPRYFLVQASNLCTYIARGDVALSIGAIFMTPLISKASFPPEPCCTEPATALPTPLALAFEAFLPSLPPRYQVLLGAIVPVDAVGVAISTVQASLLPRATLECYA